jgi:hypothetical protein
MNCVFYSAIDAQTIFSPSIIWKIDREKTGHSRENHILVDSLTQLGRSAEMQGTALEKRY